MLGKQFYKKYEYDILNRLVSESSFEIVNAKSFCDDETLAKKQLTGTNSWAYDLIGNILFSNSDKQLLYQYDNRKPQQAIKIGDDDLISYDSFGNIIETKDYKIKWNSYSKAKEIKISNQTIQFQYGPY